MMVTMFPKSPKPPTVGTSTFSRRISAHSTSVAHQVSQCSSLVFISYRNPSFPCLLRRDEIETEQKNAHHFYFRDDKNFTDCYQRYNPHWASIKYNSGDYFIHYIGRTAGSMDYHNLAGGHNICCRCVCAEELHDPADCSLMSGCVHLKC